MLKKIYVKKKNLNKIKDEIEVINKNNFIKIKKDKIINKNKFEKLLLIWNSIKINYKSWLFFVFAIYCLSYQGFLIGIINFIIYFLMSYLGHYLSHYFTKFNKLSYLSTIHDYHHKYNDWFGFYTEILYEFILATYISFIKVLSFFYINSIGLNYIFTNYISIPLNIFISFFYTSVHYINYSYFHCNNIHEIHHKNEFLNMGPDICDILFNTKSDKNYTDRFLTKKEYDNNIENTDHYIPNIIISLIIIFLFNKFLINEINYQKFYKIFFYFYLLCFVIIILCTLYVKKYMNNQLNENKPVKNKIVKNKIVKNKIVKNKIVKNK